jgi:hypothetical protein
MITPTVGKMYMIKLTNGSKTSAICTAVETHEGFNTTPIFGTKRHIRGFVRYVFKSLRTGRVVILKSRQKILSEVEI